MIRRSIILIIVGMLAAAVLYDRVDRTPDPDVVAPAAPVLTPEILTPNLLATTWYCPMGVAAADHTVVVSNLSNEEAVGSIEMMTASGPGPELRFDLGPLATEFINLESALAPSEATGALIEVVGGDAVVGHQLAVAGRVVEGPCHSATSDTWYFAAGATSRGTREVIALLNPSYDDVVFSATFETPTRTITPGDLEAAVVPARSVRLIEVTDAVSREAVVATRIETVRGGLAVERLQLRDGTLGPIGAALTLGVTDAATDWELPVGQVHAGGDAEIVVTNPTDLPAEVDLYLVPNDPADRGRFGLVPEELDLRAGGVVTVDLDDLAVLLKSRLARRALQEPLEHHEGTLGAVAWNTAVVLMERMITVSFRRHTPVGIAVLEFDVDEDEISSGELDQTMASEFRREDIFARYGGEEFAVLLPETTAPEAAEIADRLRAAVEQVAVPGAQHQPLGRLTISIGAADTDGGPVDDLVERADAALYEAKHGGRNQVRVDGAA